MSDLLLEVNDLKTWLDTESGTVRAVDGISFTMQQGETVAILGESGCGKSMSALSLLQLVPSPAGRIEAGSVRLEGRDILQFAEKQMREVRGKRIAMIFQEPQTSLNPVMTIGEQIREVLPDRESLSQEAARTEVLRLLTAVGISDVKRRYDEYPHQLSGGMKQRAMIAMALAGSPDILIADEPTTALDVTIQAQILDLLKSIQNTTGMAVLLITHDLGIVSQSADRVLVMYAGQIVEQAPSDLFFSRPRHPYSQKLFRALPGRGKRGARLEVIPGAVPPLTTQFSGCRFVQRCERAQQICHETVPAWHGENNWGVRCHFYDTEEPVRNASETSAVTTAEQKSPGEAFLKVESLKIHFPIQKGILRRTVGYVKAVDDISFEINKGRTLALVGESGCGKTTAGKGVLQLIRPTAGSVNYLGKELTQLSRGELRALRRQFQIIFQDPYASLNPRMLVSDIVAEGLDALQTGIDATSRQQKINALLEKVGLNAEAGLRYPHEFSGGQRQRISIARALAVDPQLIVCDEPTSALDVSVQAQVLNLLKQLQDDLGLSYLFITHDLSVVEYLAHDVAVMYLGRIVESGTLQEILDHPAHPYTRALLSAAPVITRGGDKPVAHEVIKLEGDIPSPSDPPRGCHFHPRCTVAESRCRKHFPETTMLTTTHSVRCHLQK
ncbi:MAG: ABC transporter ATP-binding protein [Gammaproteobacteria bacterium]|nr:ABC transporter ATP-binding protein [Gammaproteobacteria bacterium]